MSFEPLRTVTGVAAPLLRPNVDTDVIIRIDRLVTKVADLAPFAFEAIRFNADGSPNPEFVLNQERFAGATILIGGSNFGCGSSREPAVWAIASLGIRVVIAPSFGDIFQSNCYRNGLLAITLDERDVRELGECAATGEPVTVDLEAQQISFRDRRWPFAIGATQRLVLIEGLDDFDLAMRDLDAISEWQQKDRLVRGWAWTSVNQNPR